MGKDHFAKLVPRVKGVTNHLGWLFPNTKGPKEKIRHLCSAMIKSMILYGSPAWHREAQGKGDNRKVIRRIQRQMAIRTIRMYRTISFQTAVALAGLVGGG